jgi:hypothetical protein
MSGQHRPSCMFLNRISQAMNRPLRSFEARVSPRSKAMVCACSSHFDQAVSSLSIRETVRVRHARAADPATTCSNLQQCSLIFLAN